MQEMTRRNFVGTAALGAAGLVATASASGAATARAGEVSTPSEADIEWGGLYDVVVIGMGIAGEAAAIDAADAGARVLVLEKGPDGLDGGNTRYCHQYAISVDPDRVEDAKTYFSGLRGLYSFPTDEQIKTTVDGLTHLEEWFEGLGATIYTYEEATGSDFPQEYPELPGAGCIKGFGVSPKQADGKMFKFLKQCIIDRSDTIDLWFSAAATDLIQDAQTGAIIGVTADVDGTSVNIRAKNGVVLSCGGFENNPQMIQDYAGVPEAYPIACHFNTGDGHLMAQRVGAQMSAMHNMMCYINCLYDDGVTAEWNSGTRFGKANYTTSLIFAAADGTRFMNENFKARHGYMPWHGNYRLQHPTVPAWCVLDEKALGETFLSNTMSTDEGKAAALESGRLIKADTLEELAAAIEVPAENLTAAVARYNMFCEQGEDLEFARDSETLVALDEKGPFYAFRLVQSVLNTQGGPRRNKDAQIVDTNGDPIPHLFGAGECGEMFTSCYQGSGNLGLGLVYGRIAGKNAAAAKDDAQPAADLVIKEFVPAAAEEPTYEAGEGQLIGRADSHCGELVLRVTTDGDAISGVEVLHSYDTPNIGLAALTKLSGEVVGMTAAQVADIDTVTYATISSEAFKAAIANAFEG